MYLRFSDSLVQQSIEFDQVKKNVEDMAGVIQVGAVGNFNWPPQHFQKKMEFIRGSVRPFVDKVIDDTDGRMERSYLNVAAKNMKTQIDEIVKG